LTYDANSIPKLLARLRKYDITKGEMIMIINLRPTDPPMLNTIIESMGDRFDEEEQLDIVAGIAEVLGQFEVEEDPEEMEGEEMDEAGQ
jgi:hypothetical protein